MTERTFFRHFPDKREVLFDGERRLTRWVTEALASVPADVAPWPAMRRTVDLIVPPLEANREGGERLAGIAAATPAVQERAAAKEAHLIGLIVDLLVARGVAPEEASLVARTCWGVLAHAIGRWRAAPGTPLQSHVDRAFELLGDLLPRSPAPSARRRDPFGPHSPARRQP